MDSHRLRHFLAVVDHGGFTAAAQAVYVSQPALSLAVKELEAELGVALFVRTGRKVRLTAAGVALLGPARQVLRDLETGEAAGAGELCVTEAHDIPGALTAHSWGRQSLVLLLPPGSAHVEGAAIDLSSLAE